MERVRRLLGSGYASNGAALAGAMLALSLSTLVVARLGGPAAVGDYALLRMLPWLVALLATAGLPASITYFLAGPLRGDRRVKPTLAAIAAVGAVVGVAAWLGAVPLLRRFLFAGLSAGLVAAAALKIPVRLAVITAKASAQGSDDLPGSNLAIFLEEATFLPLFLVLLGARWQPPAAIVGALVLADVATGLIAWGRLARRGFFRDWGLPSPELARRVYAFAARGQLGALMNLLNLRLDFLILDALAGPAVLGVYAVATKYAELLRLVSIASNWVLYPRFAGDGDEAAARRASRLAPRAGAVTTAAAVLLAPAAGFVIPILYGSGFTGAVLPAQVIFIGLCADGAAGVLTAYLFGRGRPGLNSVATGAGLLVTVALDVVLIPRWGATGAAVTSTFAYLTTTSVLVFCYFAVRGGARPGVAPSAARRGLDIAVSACLLALSAPLLAALVLGARKSTGASGIFRQPRVGQGGRPFELLKIRSMRPSGGPDVTAPGDARVTRFGGFLRRTSLDELPQLVNVLRGDMTLVGPRPETTRLAAAYPPQLRTVFEHRPGVTGPVQVQMRDHSVLSGLEAEAAERFYLEVMVPKRVALDLAFLERPTLPRTLLLLLATALHVAGAPAADAAAARASAAAR